jgi:hypothetical protein
MIFLAAVVAMGDVGTATGKMWTYISSTSTEAMQ